VGNNWIIWILIINACLALTYFIYRGLFRRELKKAILMTVFMVFTPVVGVLFLVGSEAVNLLLFRKKDRPLDGDELSFSKKRVRMIIDDDIEKEVDRVPIDEALLISDTMNRRQMFLEVLKRPDVEDYMSGIRNYYGIEKEKKLLLYAPTFRQTLDTKENEHDIGRCLQALSERFGTTFVCLFRQHPNVDMTRDDVLAEDIIFAGDYPDMQELMAASDVLITDYSGCMFEFMLTGKPVFLFV